MKKIMILGAGIYQVPLILKAKEMGLYVICVSIAGDYPGFKLADKIYYLDTRDYEGILRTAMAEHIDGICTTGTDVALKAVGYVNDKMKLHGICYNAANICTDKALMKECFINNKVSTSQFNKISSLSMAKDFVNEYGFPVIIKPVDSSGSRGITKAASWDELDSAYEKAKKYTSKDYVVIEQFIDGYEIGVDAFVVDNVVQFVAIHGKINYFNGSTCVPIGHYFPLEANDELIKKIELECKHVITSVGMDNCSVNMDVIISGNQPFILEASGRCGATCIPELISMYYGFDYYQQMINCAIGDKVVFEKNNVTPCVAKLIISDKSGTIVSQDIVTDRKDIQVSFDYNIGDYINKFEVGPDRIGQIIAKGEELKCDDIISIKLKD